MAKPITIYKDRDVACLINNDLEYGYFTEVLDPIPSDIEDSITLMSESYTKTLTQGEVTYRYYYDSMVYRNYNIVFMYSGYISIGLNENNFTNLEFIRISNNLVKHYAKVWVPILVNTFNFGSNRSYKPEDFLSDEYDPDDASDTMTWHWLYSLFLSKSQVHLEYGWSGVISNLKSIVDSIMIDYFFKFKSPYKQTASVVTEMKGICISLISKYITNVYPKITKTYINSTWSTNKTFYIKTTFSCKSYSKDNITSGNVVNYDTIYVTKRIYITLLYISLYLLYYYLLKS